MSAVVQMTYQPADPNLPHVEVLDFIDLRRMNCGVTQRADFLVLAFVTAGRGAVTIDFERHILAPGDVACVAPGAVHRWDDFADLEGVLVLCDPTSPLTAATRAAATTPRTPAVFSPTDDEAAYLLAALDHLVLEARPDVPGSSPELHASLLTALLARMPAAPRGEHNDRVFEQFRASVEADFRRHRDVGHYAHELGYAERTLTRRVIAATGTTAKTLIEERVVLEAKRLLVHHRMSASGCAAQLGFADPSAFSSFFRRIAGTPPGAWRSAQATR